MSNLWEDSTHVWKKNEYDEEMDVFAGTAEGYHNGPLCVVCGYTACMHCVSNPEPCTGPSPESKNIRLLKEFYTYCYAHPEERFWQALRNWSGVNAVLIDDTLEEGIECYNTDTFNWEGRNG